MSRSRRAGLARAARPIGETCLGLPVFAAASSSADPSLRWSGTSASAITDLAPTEQMPTVETCGTWCGASVASRYTRCGPMFTVATDGKVGVASPPPSRVGRAARCRTIGCIAAVAFRAVLSDPRRQRPLDTRPRVEMLPDSQRARSHCPDGTTGASRYLPHAKGRPPMTKLLSSVGVALVTLLAGCSLYFGTNGSGGDGNGATGGPGGGTGGGN